MTIKVFLLDDHELVRAGLRSLLKPQEDLEVVGDAGTVEEALLRIPVARPDVAILDVRLSDGNGIEVCRQIRSDYPEIACLVLTSYPDGDALLAAIMAGASGYIMKHANANDLVSAIRTVGDGGTLLDPELTDRVLERIRRGPEEDERLASLTPQERRILDRIAEGKTNRQIGEDLFLAEKTVKNYVSNLLAKLGMERRTEAAVFITRMAERKPSFTREHPATGT